MMLGQIVTPWMISSFIWMPTKRSANCQEADSILNKSSDCSQREDRHQGRQSKLKSKAEAIKEAKSGLEQIMKRKAEGQCPKPKKKKTELR